ncbi:MAG: hypothetical protein AB1640_15745 [bacterium]
MASRSYKAFRELLDRKAFAEAAALAERNCLDGSSDSAFWHTQRAVALSLAGRFEQAVAAADQALQREPGNAYALAARAGACLGDDRAEEALAGYEEALRSGDARILPRARKGLLQSLSMLKRWPQILGALSEWNLPPETAYPWRIKALAGLDRRDEALDACAELLRVSPDHPQALWQMADLEISRDGLEAVRMKFARLARIPTPPPRYSQ